MVHKQESESGSGCEDPQARDLYAKEARTTKDNPSLYHVIYTWTKRFTYEVCSKRDKARSLRVGANWQDLWWSRAVVRGEIAVYALMVCSSTSHSIRSGSK